MRLTVVDGHGEMPISADVATLARLLGSGGFADLWRHGGYIRVMWTSSQGRPRCEQAHDPAALCAAVQSALVAELETLVCNLRTAAAALDEGGYVGSAG